jgi:FkbM family methyltransferase
MDKSVLSFYLWAYDNDKNVSYILSELRKCYPDSDLVISSDNGYDFSDICNTYNACHYIHGKESHGYPTNDNRYGWTANAASIWFNRVYEACKIITTDYVMLMEEDVLVKDRFRFPATDIIMIPNIKNPISPSGMNWVKSRGGSVKYPYYSAGGGTIINRKKFIQAYDNHINDLLLNYDDLYEKSFNEGVIGWGWNDSLICVLMYAENAKISTELPILESGNENDSAPIIHKFKKYYVKQNKVHFISFITQGAPYDKGLPLGHLKQKLIDEYSPYFDKVTIYTIDDVPIEFRQEYNPNVFETRFNPGYHNIGYGAFKPYLILKTMNESDCDVIYWRDGNIEKNPNMLIGKESVKQLSINILNEIKTDIFVPFENPNWVIGNTTPSVVFEKILGTASDNYVSYPQMNAALIICKKTDYVKNLLNEWISWMKHDEFFYKEQPINHSNYNMNCGDQGILNVMLLNEIRKGNLPQGWPFFGYEVRQFTQDKLYKIKNIAKIMSTVTINEHTFFPDKLSENPVIVDLGCSEGGFLEKFKNQFKYGTFIGIEASPLNYEKIKHLNDDKTIIVNAAVCSEQREETEISFLVAVNDGSLGSFVFDESSIALAQPANTLTRYVVPTIKISEIFDKYNLEKIDVLKVDIEGAEWEVLEGLDEILLNKIEQISVEFHDFIDPSKKDRTEEVVKRLKSFGFKTIISGAPWFYGTEHFDCTFYKD